MGAIENRKLIYILAGLLLLVTAAFGWSLTHRGDEGDQQKEDVQEASADQPKAPEQTACGSNATYARLKEVVFEDALKQQAADPANLDKLAQNSVVRMEEPVVKSRDEDLNVTVCSGRFILELPPGAETAFGGQRRLAADIEYSAQAAADGSGLVYQIRGAEPIVSRLAAFDLSGRPMQAPQNPQAPVEYAEAAPAAPETLPAPAPKSDNPVPPPAPAAPAPSPRAPKTVPGPAIRVEQPPAPRSVEPSSPPREAARATFSNPSFPCRAARTPGERAVCSSQSLAAKDRAMSSMFYSAMASADGPRRAELRRTRDKFLRYRDRCRDEACIADAYEGRMREIRDIMEAE